MGCQFLIHNADGDRQGAATNELINGIALAPDDGVGAITGLGGSTTPVTAYNNGSTTVVGPSAGFTDKSTSWAGMLHRDPQRSGSHKLGYARLDGRQQHHVHGNDKRQRPL